MYQKHYLSHYLVLLIVFVHFSFDFSKNKASIQDIYPSTAIHGINNADDKVKHIVYRYSPPKNKPTALETTIKLKIRAGFTGGNCRYELPYFPSDAWPLLNENIRSGYYTSFIGIKALNSLKLRGPPAFLI
jgi:hypothetical protein